MKKVLQIITISFFLISCSKGFLEEQPNSNILTPKKMEDFQRLLDNFEIVGRASVLPQLSADEYYINSEADWLSSRTAIEKNAYIWDEDIYGGEGNIGDWNFPYNSIFYANNIISEIEESGLLGPMDKDIMNIYGQALFHRAYANYDLLKNYSVPFDEITQSTDLGIPLRRDPSIDYISPRSTVKECYDLIFEDLEKSLDYLQYLGPIVERNRPTKLAVYALLSRIYLYRAQYDQSEKWADEFLKNYSRLVDYNTLSLTSTIPFAEAKDELIMYGITEIYNNARANNTSKTVFVDTSLIDLYDHNDLRLSVYFKMLEPGKYIMKAGYNGKDLAPFKGLAVDEVILNKIECLIRKQELTEATTLINRLLENRYKSGTFVPVSFSQQQSALDFILLERRKELVYRCLRWDDIKRLNKAGAGIVLKRVLGDKEYVLEPGSPRYVFNIPQDEINRSGIEQNKR